MGKFIFWLVVILGGMMLGRILAQQKQRSRQTPPLARKRAPQQPPVEQTEAMVRCAHCHIHLPRSEAVFSQGETWCSMDHARLGPGTPPRH